MHLSDSRRPKAFLIPLCLTLALFAANLPAQPRAKSGVMLACNTTCSAGMGCTVTAACSPGAPNTCAFIGESIVAANMANCTLGAVDGMAMAMATAGTPATCSIYFSNLCGATTMCTAGFFTTVVNTCVVNTADGLPVELMDFSVDSDSDSGSQKTPDDQK